MNDDNRGSSSQQRAGKFQAVLAAHAFRDQFRQFDTGSKKFKRRLEASDDELLEHVNDAHTSECISRRGRYKVAAFELLRLERAATQAVIREVTQLEREEKYSYIPREKPDDAYCLMYKN